MNKDKRFLMIPLIYLADLDKDKVFDYAICNFAKSMKITHSNAVQEVLYDFYRRTENLTYNIEEFINELENQKPDLYIIDPDYDGFTIEGEFSPLELDEIISEVIKQEMMKDFIEYASIKKALKLFQIKPKKIEPIIDNYWNLKTKLDTHISENPNPVICHVSVGVFWEFYLGSISEQSFRMYAALRSSEGNRKYASITKGVVAMRMMGAKNRKVLSELIKQDEQMDYYQKISGRYQIDETINDLIDRGLLVKINGGRCWYVSTKITEIELKEIYQSVRTKSMKIASSIQKEEFQNIYLS